MKIEEKLIKLSIDIFNAEGDCGFTIIKHDGIKTTIFLDYLNPFLLAKLEDDNFILKNITARNLNKGLIIEIETKTKTN